MQATCHLRAELALAAGLQGGRGFSLGPAEALKRPAEALKQRPGLPSVPLLRQLLLAEELLMGWAPSLSCCEAGKTRERALEGVRSLGQQRASTNVSGDRLRRGGEGQTSRPPGLARRKTAKRFPRQAAPGCASAAEPPQPGPPFSGGGSPRAAWRSWPPRPHPPRPRPLPQHPRP